jgi:magnesium-transporting ATPase (P-type)
MKKVDLEKKMLELERSKKLVLYHSQRFYILFLFFKFTSIAGFFVCSIDISLSNFVINKEIFFAIIFFVGLFFISFFLDNYFKIKVEKIDNEICNVEIQEKDNEYDY